jgi:predicted TIM-barrel fold metal-dependent hydrolase
LALVVAAALTPAAGAQSRPDSNPAYTRLKAHLDAIPAIDTHDHLWPFDRLPGYVETAAGKGMNLAGLWRNSYLTRVKAVTPWTPGGRFPDWWAKAKHDFDDVRAVTFYRYQAAALKDLYGVDFDRVTDAEAADLDRRIYRNYLTKDWLVDVVTRRANIELMFNDPYWARFDFKTDYPFGVLVLNVTTLTRGFNPAEFKSKDDSPYEFAQAHGLRADTLDQYLAVLDKLFAIAKGKGAVCLKTTLAYERGLDFANVSRDRAARAFGQPRGRLAAAEVKDFEDFVMWRLVELSAKHGLPFQIHTGDARIQGSNPMLLVDLIEANPDTKFVLFHGGYPWVGETGAIAMKYPTRVWVDSCWLPTISYATAKRAFHEWLDVMPSDRIMWGADCNHAEGIYGATEFTRRCLAEVLAERVARGELTEEHARRIGRQVLRDNALALFPQLKDRLWKDKPKDGVRR